MKTTDKSHARSESRKSISTRRRGDKQGASGQNGSRGTRNRPQGVERESEKPQSEGEEMHHDDPAEIVPAKQGSRKQPMTDEGGPFGCGDMGA